MYCSNECEKGDDEDASHSFCDVSWRADARHFATCLFSPIRQCGCLWFKLKLRNPPWVMKRVKFIPAGLCQACFKRHGCAKRVLTHVVCRRYGEATVPVSGKRRRTSWAGWFVGWWRTWIEDLCPCDSGGDGHSGKNDEFSSRTPSRPFAGQCGGGSGQSRSVAAEDACWTWICRTSITSDDHSCCAILSVSTRTGSNAHWKETVKCEALRVAKRISHFSGGFAHFRQLWPAAFGM